MKTMKTIVLKVRLRHLLVLLALIMQAITLFAQEIPVNSEREGSAYAGSYGTQGSVGFSPPSSANKMTGFTAILDKKEVMLNWLSVNEEDFSHFVIQKSTDGKRFSDIAIVFTRGDQDVDAGYVYKDRKIISRTGYLFYRLVMVDGSVVKSISPIKKIRL
jgi:biopolymer transport protein ExbD